MWGAWRVGRFVVVRSGPKELRQKFCRADLRSGGLRSRWNGCEGWAEGAVAVRRYRLQHQRAAAAPFGRAGAWVHVAARERSGEC